MGVVFINYRAKDNPLGAAGIHDMLARRFGADVVFRDCVSMAAGEHYPTKLREGLERADVLVAVIGPRWNEVADEQGRLLIQRDRDWVRWEIARAIKRKIPIVPVLLRGTPDNATPPDRAILPESIHKLAEYQTFEVRQKRFGDDLDRLADRLIELVPSLARPRDDQGTSRDYASTGADVGDINLVNGFPVRTRYREQVRRIAPNDLLDREQELADLAEFCTDPATAGRYLWWRAQAWSGKSALLSWFVLHPPPGVRIVSFFITGRLASQNDRAAFIDNLLEQLLTLLDQSPPPFLTDTTREAYMLGLLAEAAAACQARGEQFVLVVDGLDEDRGAHSGADWHSIANLLPDPPPAGLRVIVASRADPPLPEDVPQRHALHDLAIRRSLLASPHAADLRAEMERDLIGLLRGGRLGRDLLGLVVAAGGGLSIADLVVLTECAPWEVREHLKTVAGRSFSSRAGRYRPDTVVYLLAHEDLQVTARDQLGDGSLAGYHNRLHSWAQHYRDLHWPDDTPDYLLRGYSDMLMQAGDLPRLVACMIDRDRQERLLLTTGGDSTALTETVKAIDVCAAAPTVNLNAVVRLAQHRDRLRGRNAHIPTDLPAVWVLLGEIDRAEAIARSITSRHGQEWALQLVAEAVARAGEPDRAVGIACTITDPRQQANTLAGVGGEIAQAGDPSRAVDIARSIPNPVQQAELLQLAAVEVARTGEEDRAWALLREAEEIAHTITNPSEQAVTLHWVAGGFARVGKLDHAVEIVRAFTDPGQRARSLLAAAEVAQANGEDRASALLCEAEEIARTITNAGQQSAVLQSVAATVVVWNREIDHAVAIARSIAGPGQQAPVMQAVAAAIARIGELDRAEEIARTITDSTEQARAMGAVAEVAALTGESRRAMEIASTITNHDQQVTALQAIVVAVAKKCGPDRAVEIASKIADHGRHAQALVLIASVVARVGESHRAVEIAHSITDPSHQASALQAVAKAVAQAGEHDRARVILREAEQIARSITDPSEQTWALQAAAKTVARAGEHDRARVILREAEQIARSITRRVQRETALQAIAAAIARAGEPDRAVKIARSISDHDQQASVLREVSEVVAQAGESDRAVEIACLITDHSQQAFALGMVAEAIAEVGEADRAVEIACSITDNYYQAQALRVVAEIVARAGEPDQAEGIARTITDHHQQARALRLVAEVVARAGEADRARALLHEAEEIARTVNDPWEQARALQSIAGAVARVGEPSQAEGIARTIADHVQRSVALQSISAAVARVGEPGRARALLHEAEEITRCITDPSDQALALQWIAVAVVRAGEPDQAVETVRTITNLNQQVLALQSVAEAIAEVGDADRAVEIARSIADHSQQAQALRAVSEVVARAGEPNQAEEIARAITEPAEQIRALQSIIDRLEPAQKLRLLAQQVKLTHWYESSPDLISTATEAFNEGVHDMLTRSSRSQ